MKLPEISLNRIRKMTFPALVLALMVTTGCATRAADPGAADGAATQVSANGPSVESVLKEPGAHQKSAVQWGGTVVGIENRENATWIEVVDKPLDENGRPNNEQLSKGRFLAVVPEFLDPTDYQPGRQITVSGNVDGSDTRKIGDADFDYPKVVVAEIQLWLASDNNTQLARSSSRFYYSPFVSKFSFGFGSRGFRGFRGGIGFSSRGRFGRSGFSRSRFRGSRGFSSRSRGFSGSRGFRGRSGFGGRRH